MSILKRVYKHAGIPLMTFGLFLSACSNGGIPATAFSPTLAAIPSYSSPAPNGGIATPTDFPELPSSDLDESLAWLFALNSTPVCKLPCWWGIEPGRTYFDRVFKIIEPFGAKEIEMPFVAKPGWVGFYFNESYLGGMESHLYFDHQIYVGAIHSFPLLRSTLEGDRLFKTLSPQYVFSDLGTPNLILIRVPLNMADPGSSQSEFDAWVVYTDLGAMFEYRGLFTLPDTNEEIQICLGFENLTYITVYLAEVGEQTLFLIDEAFVGAEDSISQKMAAGEILDSQRAFGITPEQFGSRIANEDVCFSTPLELWLN